MKTLKKKQRELEEKSEANDKILQTNIETVRDELMEQIKQLEDLLRSLTEDFKKKPSIDEYRLKNGASLQQEMDRLAFLVGETHGVILKIRGDQVQALASNTLCLSCGRGDVNFLPPVEVVKGTNGQYYRGLARNNSMDYDVGIDVFTKEETTQEHTFQAHLPLDSIIHGDADARDREAGSPFSQRKKTNLLRKTFGSKPKRFQDYYKQIDRDSSQNNGKSYLSSKSREGSVVALENRKMLRLGREKAKLPAVGYSSAVQRSPDLGTSSN